MGGGAKQINRNRSASVKLGTMQKKMKNVRDCCGADSVQRGCAEDQAMSLMNNGTWVRCMVVRFGFFNCSHTSQFDAHNRKWSTAEVVKGARQYTQEQRCAVTR